MSVHHDNSNHTLFLDPSHPLYANVGASDSQDGQQRHSVGSRSSTLPSHRSSDGDNYKDNFKDNYKDNYDAVSSSSKEKKSSVLGRFLGRRNK